MSLYESVFITRQDISSSQAEALVDSFAEIIANSGGSVPKKEYWGLRNLAYRIKKNRKGHYVMLNIDSPVVAINELERNERLHEDVLRYLTLRVDELAEGPSVMARGRKERSGRDRDEGYRARDNRSGASKEKPDASADKPAASDDASAKETSK